MATTTDNYSFIIPEGSDNVNLLTQNNPNWESADEIIKSVSDLTVGTATELFTTTVHALTRAEASADAAMFRFTAVSNYTAGDTFTVDGVQVTALLTTGEALGSGAYIIGSEVLCCLKGTLLTVFVNSGTVTNAQDSEKLGGELPAYYAKQTDMTAVEGVASAAGTLAGQNQQAIAAIEGNINNKILALPDYSNKTDISSLFGNVGNTYVAPNNGFIYIRVQGQSNANVGVRFTINDSEVYLLSDSNSGYAVDSSWCVIGKDDILKITQRSNVQGLEILFVPFR